MGALVCELCGGTNLVKQDGLYVCQDCGAKYSLEEARKMLNTTPDGSGITVKVDQTDELKNLYALAHRAKTDNNTENARKYYDQILIKDPQSWEANFYATYYQSMGCKIGEIQSAAIRLSNCEDTVLQLLIDGVTDEEERKAAVAEMTGKLISIATMLFNAAKAHYDGIGSSIKSNYTQEYVNNCMAARDILYLFGDHLINMFGDTYGEFAARCWKIGITQHQTLMPNFANKEINKTKILQYVEKIQKYDPDFPTPEISTASGGCYVATAVYGSYDCPQVWTLRRFRDTTLAGTWYGRAFIHTYYAISPTLVKWFGKTEWFKNMWKPRLDRMVEKLHKQGVEDTPYSDLYW